MSCAELHVLTDFAIQPPEKEKADPTEVACKKHS